jgi:hypothetical protein
MSVIEIAPPPRRLVVLGKRERRRCTVAGVVIPVLRYEEAVPRPEHRIGQTASTEKHIFIQ